MKLSKGSHASLSYSQMPALMFALRAQTALSARALEFLILSNVRTDSVLKAKWTEFDLEAAVWTVPLTSLKDRKHRKEGFRVPLSPRALQIIRSMQQARVSSFVFPGQARGKPFSNMAFLTLLKRINAGDKRWIYNCRGAREGGDVIAMVRYVTGCSFVEACELITREPRPDHPWHESPTQRVARQAPTPAPSLRSDSRGLGLWRKAAPIYHTPANRYLGERGFAPPYPATLRYLSGALPEPSPGDSPLRCSLRFRAHRVRFRTMTEPLVHLQHTILGE
jgi:hypothetical protein